MRIRNSEPRSFASVMDICTRQVAIAVVLVLTLIQSAEAWNGRSATRVPDPLCRTSCWNVKCASRVTRRRIAPFCSLERLPYRSLRRVAPLRPTADNMISSFGQTAAERHGRIVDALALTGMVFWMGFFASRTLLGPLAWICCGIFVVFQIFIGPLLEAFRRSSELWGGGEGRKKTRGALFIGRVTRTGLALASESSNHRTHFQMLVEDEDGRELLFDTPQLAEYEEIQPGMHCEVVILSRTRDFTELTGVTEAYLPALRLFVGQFPLMNKRAFGDLLRSKKTRHNELHEGRNTSLSSSRRRTRIERGERAVRGGQPRGRARARTDKPPGRSSSGREGSRIDIQEGKRVRSTMR